MYFFFSGAFLCLLQHFPTSCVLISCCNLSKISVPNRRQHTCPRQQCAPMGYRSSAFLVVLVFICIPESNWCQLFTVFKNRRPSALGSHLNVAKWHRTCLGVRGDSDGRMYRIRTCDGEFHNLTRFVDIAAFSIYPGWEILFWFRARPGSVWHYLKLHAGWGV